MKRFFCLTVALLMALTLVASGESSSSAGSAKTDTTSAQSSSASAGAGTGSEAAAAKTPNTVSEASSAGTGGGASASGAYSATPSTSAESSSASAGGAGGGASSSSSYSSTTTTTTTTTTSSSSSSSSSSSGGGTYIEPLDPWLPWPPPQPSSHRKSSGSSKAVESIIRTEEVTGKGWTLISKVNVRTMPSIAAGQVVQIRNAGTEVMVTAEVLNSSGETWYAVKLYQGYVGYIRSDLLRVEVTEEMPKDKADETIVTTVKNKTNGSPKVIYVIVEPTQAPKEEEEETQIIYITPDQAQEMGLLNGTFEMTDVTNRNNTEDTSDGDPVNG